MKKKSNWFWLGVIGVLLLASLIWTGARLSGMSVPLPSFSIPPVVSGEPVTSAAATPDPVASETPTASGSPTPVASEPPVASDTPTPPASETPVASDSPTPAASEPPVASESPTPATSEPPVASDPPDPEESEAPPELVGPLAVVILGDYIVDWVDLGAVTESYTKVYEGFIGDGSNTVEFVPGDARVIEASCPDHVCIGQNWLVESMGGVIPVSCLPNSLALVMVPVDNTQTPEVDGATN